MNDTPSNSVLLEKILNLSDFVKSLRKETIYSHSKMIERQDKTNGRVKKCELFYAGLIGASSMIAIAWTVFTFFLK